MPTRKHEEPVTRHLPLNSSSIRPLYISPQNEEPPGCRAAAEFIFDPSLTILSLMYMVFGFLYTFFGYRLFKANMFLTGFTFATLIIYVICQQDYLLPHLGNVAVAVVSGILFGSITSLIQFVGLFINGLHTGILVSVIGLAIYDHILVEYPTTYWFCIATMTCSGIFFAIINLYWKKGMTVFGTALYGAALFSLSIDYFYERTELLKWLWDRAKLEAVKPPPCRLTWLFLAMWPFLTFVGYIAQWCLTGTEIHHVQNSNDNVNVPEVSSTEPSVVVRSDSVFHFYAIPLPRRRRANYFAEPLIALNEMPTQYPHSNDNVNVPEVSSTEPSVVVRSDNVFHFYAIPLPRRRRAKYFAEPLIALNEMPTQYPRISAQKRRLQQMQQSRPMTRERAAELKQKKYRYLYQVRTAHGDVISQSYVQALQKKAQLNNWNGSGGGECSTLQSDSTHLTVLPGSDHHHESDEDLNQIRTVH